MAHRPVGEKDRYRNVASAHPGPVRRISRPEELRALVFRDGVAALMIPWRIAKDLPLRGAHRPRSRRLDRLVRSVRAKGYSPAEPILCRVDPDGRWMVIDGGHRLTAARQVAGEVWCNLFGPRVRDLYFLVFAADGQEGDGA